MAEKGGWKEKLAQGAKYLGIAAIALLGIAWII
jgi:hypothetical protein